MSVSHMSDLCRVLRYDRLHDLFPVSGALAAGLDY